MNLKTIILAFTLLITFYPQTSYSISNACESYTRGAEIAWSNLMVVLGNSSSTKADVSNAQSEYTSAVLNMQAACIGFEI